LGFGVLVVELVYGVNEIVKHLDRIGEQLKEMGKQFDSSERNSFARDLEGWLNDIQQEVKD
jgi:hypothetical protein